VDERLERALIAAARRYAPALAPAGWRAPGDYEGALPDLARSLAEHGVLIAAVQSPAGQSALVTPVWVDGLQTVYAALAQALFPSYTGLSAFYADSGEPPLVLLQGEAIAVIMALAGYIVPYLAARHGAYPPENELLDLLDAVLDWLEAADLSRTDFLRLRGEASALLRPLLDSPARPTAIAPAMAGAPIPARARPAPPNLPEAVPKNATPPPLTLPEAAPRDATPPPVSLPEAPRPPLPLVFEPPARPARRRPPVPNLPE
jgi:hypothetical protein